MTEPCPPFFVIDMPLTKDGEGPADPADTFKVVYEVWYTKQYPHTTLKKRR